MLRPTSNKPSIRYGSTIRIRDQNVTAVFHSLEFTFWSHAHKLKTGGRPNHSNKPLKAKKVYFVNGAAKIYQKLKNLSSIWLTLSIILQKITFKINLQLFTQQDGRQYQEVVKVFKNIKLYQYHVSPFKSVHWRNH